MTLDDYRRAAMPPLFRDDRLRRAWSIAARQAAWAEQVATLRRAAYRRRQLVPWPVRFALVTR